MAKFKKGQSGNPAGRPKGIKDKRTRFRELLDKDAEHLINGLVEMAKVGDATAMRLVMDRLVPAYKKIAFTDTPLELEGSTVEKGDQIVAAMVAGRIDPKEAEAMIDVLAKQDNLKKRRG